MDYPESEMPLATDPVSRDNFDAHWLEAGVSITYPDLRHHPMREISGSRPRIRDSLSRAIVDHHVHRQRVADRLQALGHVGAAAFFRTELPRDDRTRKGNFGEVVASEHLIQRYGYAMPVFKLRYRDSNLAMRGEDIVAFKIDNQQRITCVIIGEAKTVTTYNADTVHRAHERLHKAYHPRPMTLGMLAEILYMNGSSALASQIDDIAIHLAKDDFPRENWIFLICQDCPVEPFACLNGNGNIIPDLHCVNLSLSDLTNFVNHLFDHPVLE
ncbi:DUF1837 domain-containing protein [Deltaproteobacteria bacterium PRO3]|nr:DUF1837 domain-containing protein [Deltaproteobacteria bacterium PRO3]